MPGILVQVLEDLYILRLKPLGAVGDAELHRLAFLQTLESIRLDSGEMHENISAVAAAVRPTSKDSERFPSPLQLWSVAALG